MTTLVWLRHDLRLADQPALHFAAARGAPVVPLFILEPEGPWAPGAASRAFLHDSLDALARDLAALGSRLILRAGEPLAVLRAVAASTQATALAYNLRVEPAGRALDEEIKASIGADLEVHVANGSLLTHPMDLRTVTGGPYRVFTPFWRQLHAQLRERHATPCPAPARLLAPPAWPASLALDDLQLLPAHPWHHGVRRHWPQGEAGAWALVDRFLDTALEAYSTARDLPGEEGVSRLSPYLQWGQVSPRQLWHAVHQRAAGGGSLEPSDQALAWLRQLAWRDFAHHLLWHFPATTDVPLRPEFADFPWREDAEGYRRWCHGMTGFPLVDAGMRELWATGWMHNRVRMVVASFLVKDLGLDWRQGAAWFWDTLVDANLANNTLGWQWVAGCGADAAPYFRVFNPTLQSRKFDPGGNYIARWLPALASLAPADRHAPAVAAPLVLQTAGITLDRDYPRPLLDHALARDAALARLARSKA